MFTDDNGIVRFEDDDEIAPLHVGLNTALTSVSDAIDDTNEYILNHTHSRVETTPTRWVGIAGSNQFSSTTFAMPLKFGVSEPSSLESAFPLVVAREDGNSEVRLERLMGTLSKDYMPEPRVHAAVLGDASGTVPSEQVTTITGYAVNQVTGTYLSTTSSTIKTHKKGWYEIIGTVRWDAASGESDRQLRLVHDSTYTPRVYSSVTPIVNTRFGQHVSTFALLPADGTISMQVYQNRGYSTSYTSFSVGSTSLRARWIGEDI